MQASVDPQEIAKFEAMAKEWWDPHGKFKPLHMMHPTRLRFVTEQIAAEFGRDLNGTSPFSDLRILDIGCGGGLVTEPLARLGAEVTGIDPGRANIEAARIHAAQSGVDVTYRAVTAEEVAADGHRFDVITMLEVVEHVTDPAAFWATAASMLTERGLAIATTLNRNPKSYMMGIIGAEYVMRWLPRGTHQWSKFITPAELEKMAAAAGLKTVDRKGFVFNPLSWSWRLSDHDLSVNYGLTARKQNT